jgi:hypothetical protein
MARKKQLRFTADPDVEELIKKQQNRYCDASFSQIINLLIRRSEKK